ncbi:hypothetical protein ACFYKX_01085 [Cytobacillus sp. FJAT-54145]|uniref:Uncharacterized protein n=1 Tax=Cytobacillus spartinae TaxID=3299023 RepID=A0ABW6K4X0_9BACI
MHFKMEKANMVADNLHCLIQLVNDSYAKKSTIVENQDKLYRLRHLIEEFKFQILADELKRVNRFVWDEKVSYLLMGRIIDKINVIDEYIQSNYHDLFLFSPRVDIIKSVISTFNLDSNLSNA